MPLFKLDQYSDPIKKARAMRIWRLMGAHQQQDAKKQWGEEQKSSKKQQNMVTKQALKEKKEFVDKTIISFLRNPLKWARLCKALMKKSEKIKNSKARLERRNATKRRKRVEAARTVVELSVDVSFIALLSFFVIMHIFNSTSNLFCFLPNLTSKAH